MSTDLRPSTSDRAARLSARALVVLCAVASTVAVWGAATLLLATDVTVPESPGSASRHPLDTPAVLVAACAAALAGWALLEASSG